MTCSELRDQIIGHSDNTAPSDSDVTDLGTRILEELIAIVNDVAFRRPWRWRRRTSTALTFSSGAITVPTDFAEFGPFGGLYNVATGEDLDEVDEKEIMMLRQRLSTRTDIFAIFDQDTTSGLQELQVPFTGSGFQAYTSYLCAPPTLDYTTNNDKLKVAIPVQYHQLVLVPGVQWRRQRSKGDARSSEYQGQYEAGINAMRRNEKQRRTESVQMPTFSGH